MTTILFPCEPGVRGKVDLDFASEYAAACDAGFATALYDHGALVRGEGALALARIPVATGEPIVLRGWMMPGEIYGLLETMLRERGYAPQTTRAGYEEAHYLPIAYRHLQEHTARSAWMEGDDVAAAWQLYADEFCSGDALIKDWVKSAKNCWNSGCFLPAGTVEAKFREVFRVFREERGALFNRGVVLREFMPVVHHGFDMRGMPIAEETRFFFWKGQIVVEPRDTHPSPLAERDRWETIARRFSSPFITIDVAYLQDGTWKVVEVGDGGVSGLPSGLTPEPFYANLRRLTVRD